MLRKTRGTHEARSRLCVLSGFLPRDHCHGRDSSRWLPASAIEFFFFFFKFWNFLNISLLFFLLITELAVGQVYYSNLITLLSVTNFVAFKSLFLFVCLSPGESVRFLWQNELHMREEKSLEKAVAIAFGLSPYFLALMRV